MADCRSVLKLARTDHGVLKHDHELPKDIVVEVLARLPVKSLMRFRCVCKPWRAFISDPCFVRKQFSYAAAKGSGDSDIRLMVSVNPHGSIYCLVALNDLKAPPLDITVRCPPFRFKRSRIVGSCNGLICLHVKYQFILWNPCTGDYNALPQPPGYHCSCLPSSQHCLCFQGFGYDSTTDDYKVIRGIRRFVKSIIQVFSLKSGSWKTYNNMKNVCVRGDGCLLAGALHWLEFRSPYYSDGSTIVSFDLAKEEFREDMSLMYPASRVLTIRNCISVISLQSGSPLWVKIFMMKEYGVEESWTEVLTLPIDTPIRRNRLDDVLTLMKPLCILENGQVLVSNALKQVHLRLYDPKEKAYRDVHVLETNEDFDIGYPNFEATIYRETLISPLTGCGAHI
ncbi:hypothetical protein M0R45_009429 [Rubus argutus]|uniref:F-box domain-containing protein n=1 Tax=Rubus argutus TaxID=59490 RepID=A0AAW1Y4F9_RUBAR